MSEELLYIVGSILLGLISFQKIARLFNKNQDLLNQSVKIIITPWVMMVVAAIDLLKAYLITWFGILVFNPTLTITAVSLMLLVECFSPLNKFQGSRGALSFFGIIFALSPLTGIYLAGLFLFVISFLPYRYPAIVLASGLLPMLLIAMGAEVTIISFSLLWLIICALRNMQNIINLFDGKEPTIMEEIKSGKVLG